MSYGRNRRRYGLTLPVVTVVVSPPSVKGSSTGVAAVTFPSHLPGDLLVVFFVLGDIQTTPPGWLQVDATFDAGENIQLGAYTRVATSSSESFGNSGSGNVWTALVLKDATTVDDHKTAATSSSSLTFPALSTTVDGALVIDCYATIQNAGLAITMPTGETMTTQVSQSGTGGMRVGYKSANLSQSRVSRPGTSTPTNSGAIISLAIR